VADPNSSAVRPLLLAGGGLVLVLLLALARGPVALLAASSVAVIVGIAMAIPPLMGHDGIDWDWLPDRAVEIPAEPGIANLRRLLAPDATDTAAPAQLQQLVRAIATDRASNEEYGRGRLAGYLDGPPRALDLTEADALITELEALPTQET
jgi:hypothetical protein